MKRAMVMMGVLVLLLGLAADSPAQLKFGVGPKVGVNFGTVSYDPEVTQAGLSLTKSGNTGIMIGAMAELGFAGMFAVLIEPMFVQGGNKWDFAGQGPFAGVSGTVTRNVSQLQFPVLFKVKFIQGPVRPFAFVGPNLGIILSAKQKVEGQNVQGGETDIKNDVSSANFALDFGAGAEIAVNSMAVTGDVRYSLGLSNLDNVQGSTGSAKSRGFQVQAGVIFFVTR